MRCAKLRSPSTSSPPSSHDVLLVTMMACWLVMSLPRGGHLESPAVVGGGGRMRLHYDDGVQYVIHENINQDELDRDGRISFSTFFKWMQSARMALPWLGCKYVNLASADPAIVDRRLFAVSQFLSLTADVQYAGATVAVECRIGKVGKSSIQFVYRLLHAPE
eukprot:Sspe_Gene.89591::Locus_61340_Transcript_2_2_Confidence_0.667_Length_1880::g.89591::m.89591